MNDETGSIWTEAIAACCNIFQIFQDMINSVTIDAGYDDLLSGAKQKPQELRTKLHDVSIKL
jgi:hypothetical protein